MVYAGRMGRGREDYLRITLKVSPCSVPLILP